MSISGACITIVCLQIAVLCSPTRISAKDYTVGDTNGWTTGVDYSTWVTGKTFTVGDNLVFNYGSGHTVDQVSASDYSTCTVGNAITSYSTGPATVALKTAGTYNFICGVIGHCGSGMKISVPVVAASASPSSTPTSPATPSTTNNSPAPPSTTTTTPTSITPSSGGRVSPLVAAVGAWIGMTVFAAM